MNTILRKINKFSENESGSIAMTFGILFTTIVASVSFAVDFENAQNDKKIVQRHLDATLLHLGRGDGKTNPQEPGKNFLFDSLRQSNVDTSNLTPTFTYDAVEGSVTGVVDIKPDLLVGGMFLPEITMQVMAKANPKVTGNVEIALVLDNSGSMNFGINSNNNTYVSSPNRRADSLQTAVTSMLDSVYSNPLLTPAISVIPYATSVDITDLFAGNDSNGFTGANGNSLWNLGLGNFDADDVIYQDHSRGKAVWASERFMNQNSDGSYNLSLVKPNNGSQAVPVVSQSAMEQWCSRYYVRRYGSRCINVARAPNGRWYINGYFQPYNGVMPLTKNRQDIRDYIAAFEPKGGTAGHIGAAWGLYSLLPSWNDFFDHPAGAPQDFDDTTEKYLVIMTDGEFNSAQNSSMSENDIFHYFESVCTTAREMGITIFTVGLKVESGTKTDNGLRKCVGDTGRYFSVDNHDELNGAFKNIGRAAGELRIAS